jgi:hypothetical protein
MFSRFSLLHPGFFYDADAGGGNGGGGTGDAGKAYTQDQLDQMFAERAKRAEDKARADLLKDLGVETPEAAKDLLKKQKEADDAQKSELQKAADQAAKAQKDLAELKTANEQTLAAMAKRLLDTEIKMLAAKAVYDKDGKTLLRAAFRAEAIDDLLLLVDRSTIIEKDGQYQGIDKALEALAKSRKYLLAEEEQGRQAIGSPRTVVKQPANSGATQQEDARLVTSM